MVAVDNSYRKLAGAAMGSIADPESIPEVVESIADPESILEVVESIADLESIPEVVESIADLESILEGVGNIPEKADNMTRGMIEVAGCTPGIAGKKADGVYKLLCTHELTPWRK